MLCLLLCFQAVCHSKTRKWRGAAQGSTSSSPKHDFFSLSLMYSDVSYGPYLFGTVKLPSMYEKEKKPEHALQWQLLVTVSQWVSFVMCTIVGPNICTAWWNLCYYLPKESACQVLQALQWLSNVKASGSSSSYIICKLGMTRHQSMLWSLTVLSHCLVLVGVEQAWCHERPTAAIDNLWEAQHVGLGNIAK